MLVRSVTGVTKQDELQLTESKRRVDLQTLGWYTEHAVHEDTASQSSPVLAVMAGACLANYSVKDAEKKIKRAKLNKFALRQ